MTNQEVWEDLTTVKYRYESFINYVKDAEEEIEKVLMLGRAHLEDVTVAQLDEMLKSIQFIRLFEDETLREIEKSRMK